MAILRTKKIDFKTQSYRPKSYNIKFSNPVDSLKAKNNFKRQIVDQKLKILKQRILEI